MSIYKKKFCVIDVLLDIDKRVVRIGLVTGDKKEKKQDAIIWNLPYNDHGWYPYIWYNDAFAAEIRVAKIPWFWYKQDMPIWIEPSYVERLRDVIWTKSVMLNRCYVCGKSRVYLNGKLLRCSVCKSKVRYCSVKCAQKDWKRHKKICKRTSKREPFDYYNSNMSYIH